MKKTLTHDVLIVGSGVVGLTLAALLSQLELKVALLDVKAPSSPKITEKTDLKTFAITRATENVWRHINAWSLMQQIRISPFRNMYVWDEQGKGKIEFDSASIGEPMLGHIIENSVITSALLQRIQQTDNIQIIAPIELAGLEITEAGAFLFSEDREFSGKLIVGTDGANSWIRKQANIEITREEYSQHAVVTTVKTELPHKKTAYQRFLTDGILAFLPLSDPHHCSIVWSTNIDKAKSICAMELEQVNALFTEAFAQKLGRVEVVDQRVNYPLQKLHVKNYVLPKIALAGDAAHIIHPLAGQGLNLGILDAAALADTLSQTLLKNRDIGAIDTLRRYERWRKGHNLKMLTLMDGFKNLFSSSASPIIFARNLGLQITNQIEPFKQLLIKNAMGLTGDLPKYAE